MRCSRRWYGVGSSLREWRRSDDVIESIAHAAVDPGGWRSRPPFALPWTSIVTLRAATIHKSIGDLVHFVCSPLCVVDGRGKVLLS